MSVTAFQLQGVMYFSVGNYGWSEKVWLQGASVADVPAAITLLNQIATQRLWLLPDNAKLVYARVNQYGAPRERFVAGLTFPLPGQAHELTTPVDLVDWKVEAAVAYQFETAQGKFCTRYLRCLPVAEVSADNLVPTVTIPAPTITGGTAVHTTWQAALGNYLGLLRDQTLFVQVLPPLAGTPPTPQTNSSPNASVVIRGMTTHKTGRVFGLRRGRATPR